jgi:hypothetical protein
LRFKEEILFFPDRGKSLLWLKTGYKFEKSIITECAELICLYDRSKVWIWTKDEENSNGYWKNPENQTYCASYEYIEYFFLGIDNSIPLAKELGNKKLLKLKNLYL